MIDKAIDTFLWAFDLGLSIAAGALGFAAVLILPALIFTAVVFIMAALEGLLEEIKR
jgi:hypothetical protein